MLPERAINLTPGVVLTLAKRQRIPRARELEIAKINTSRASINPFPKIQRIEGSGVRKENIWIGKTHRILAYCIIVSHFISLSHCHVLCPT